MFYLNYRVDVRLWYCGVLLRLVLLVMTVVVAWYQEPIKMVYSPLASRPQRKNLSPTNNAHVTDRFH